MNDLQMIKQRIFEEQKIEYLLDALECKYIKIEQNQKLYTAALPDGDNKRSVQVKNTIKLITDIRTKDVHGDIFDLVMYIENCDLTQAKYEVCNILNYSIDFSAYKPKKDWNAQLHEIQRKRKRQFSIIENKKIPETILNQFINIPPFEWHQQGLKYTTLKEFEVGFDIYGGIEKMIFPIRSEDGNLLSVKARVCGKHEKDEKYKDMKYFYLYPYNRQMNLYNLNKAKKYITDEVYVFEGEKTCWFAWQWGIKNCVATHGSSISPLQLQKLITLNCKITFVFDKDIETMHFNQYSKQLKSRICHCIIDKDNLLDDKSSPTDKGEDIFLKLLKNEKYKIKL